MIILSETWLKEFFNDAEYVDNSYTVFRRDRKVRRGGGVLIATKNETFSSEEVHIDDTDGLEYVCLKASTKTHVVYIYCAYIPPNSPQAIYDAHLAAMLRIASDPEDVLIFVGDFNLPDVEWAVDTDNDSILIPTKFSPEPTAIFVKGLLDMGVNQVNHVRNENAKFLDLFFTNDYTNVTIERVDQSNALKKKIEGHHPPILATFEWHGVDSTEPVTTEAFNFKRANFSEMNAYLATIDFAALFDGKTIAEKVNILHDILDKVIEKFVPKIKIKSIQKCPWKNRELITLKNRKNKAGKRFRQSGRKPCFEWQYILASREFEKLNNELYDAYVTKMKESLKHDPSRFWQYVNSKKSTDNKPKIMQLGDVRTDNEAEQANLFAEFFSSNYDDSLMQGDSNSPSDEPRPNNDFQLDINFVMEELNAVNIKKGTGPDGMHPLILKHCASHLAAPLTQIFNESLSTGHFPDKWKRSSVSPIF